MDEKSQQLTWADNHIDAELRALLTEPDDDFTIDRIITDIERKKNA